jgi:hypothetical protein
LVDFGEDLLLVGEQVLDQMDEIFSALVGNSTDTEHLLAFGLEEFLTE